MGLTFDKLFVILVIALFVVGPDRLPGYAKKLGELVRNIKSMASGAKDRMREEMGPEFEDVDWKKLDPRQYDPRRIIRDALLEDEDTPEARQQRAAAASADRRRRAPAGTPTPAAAPGDPTQDGFAGSWAGATAAASAAVAPSPTEPVPAADLDSGQPASETELAAAEVAAASEIDAPPLASEQSAPEHRPVDPAPGGPSAAAQLPFAYDSEAT